MCMKNGSNKNGGLGLNNVVFPPKRQEIKHLLTRGFVQMRLDFVAINSSNIAAFVRAGKTLLKVTVGKYF